MSGNPIRLQRGHFGILKSVLEGDTKNLAGVSRALGIPNSSILEAVAEYAASADYQGDAAEVLESLAVQTAQASEHAKSAGGASAGSIVAPASSEPPRLRGGDAEETADLVQTMAAPSFEGLRREVARHEYLVERLIGERYWIERPIGEGSFGVVYRARDTADANDAVVALKVIRKAPLQHPPLGDRENSLRFMSHSMSRDRESTVLSASPPRSKAEREGWLAASLTHPGLVPTYDFGAIDDGHFFIAMQLCDADLSARSGQMAPAQAVRIMAGIAEATGYLHAQGILHRDIKPANVLLDQSGQAFLGDFGLALRLDEPRSGVAGTPAYMSPEQILGWYDGRADVYSLGMTLYQVLAGRLPFDYQLFQGVGDDLNALQKRVYEADFVPLREFCPEVDEHLQAIVHRAIARSVGERHPSAASFAAELNRWSADHQLAPSPERPNAPSAAPAPYAAVNAARTKLGQAYQSGDDPMLARGYLELGSASLALGNAQPALIYFTRASDRSQKLGDTAGRADATWQLALAWERLGQRHRALAAGESALALQRSIDSPRVEEIERRIAAWHAE